MSPPWRQSLLVASRSVDAVAGLRRTRAGPDGGHERMRTQRDATLDMPVLILPAVQINIRAGELPPKEDNGLAYVKIPLNAL